jgi:hypothetical protein
MAARGRGGGDTALDGQESERRSPRVARVAHTITRRRPAVHHVAFASSLTLFQNISFVLLFVQSRPSSAWSRGRSLRARARRAHGGALLHRARLCARCSYAPPPSLATRRRRRRRRQVNKKQEVKKQDGVIQDRTFGLKNKGKSAKVQSYVKQVEQNARSACAQKGMLTAEQSREQKKNAKIVKMQARRRRRLVTLFFSLRTPGARLAPYRPNGQPVCQTNSCD